MIPKIIHKIIITDDYKIPKFDDIMKKAIDSFKIMNPNYEIRFYSGQDCVDYINKYYSEKELFMFNCLLPYAYKCDLMKYLILYNEGGYYSDMKMVCLEPFDNIFPEDIQWFSAIDRGYLNRMSNGFILSNKGNIFLKKTLDKIYTNCLLQKKGKTSLYPTGPAILAEIYNQHKSDDMGGIYIGKHIKDENDLYHFFDHNDKKFLKTKYTQENGKEFSAGSWDKFDNIKGNNYNHLWSNDNIYKKTPFIYNEKRFIFFTLIIIVVFKNICSKRKPYKK